MEDMVDLFKAMAGPGLAYDEALTSMTTGRTYDGCFCPEGTPHQLVAIMTQGATGRSPWLQ